jgi:Undecaprenyl-phosphate galactose phosphotransferase WbaP
LKTQATGDSGTNQLPGHILQESPDVDVGLYWWTRSARVAVFILSDLLALFLSAAFAYLLWALPVRNMGPDLYLQLWPAMGLFIAGWAHAGLYPGLGLGPVESIRRLSIVTVFAFVLLATLSFALKLPHQYSRMTFFIAFLLALALVPTLRYLTLGIVGRRGWWREPVVLIGNGGFIRRTISTLRESPKLGYRPLGILRAGSAGDAGSVDGIPVLGDLGRSEEIRRAGVRVALVNASTFSDMSSLDELQRHFNRLLLIQDYEALPVEGVQIRNLGGVVGVEYSNNLLQPQNRLIKRLLDVGLASVGLVFSLPIIGICTLWIRVKDGPPVFFYQGRAGLRGRRFTLQKLRTMQLNAHAELETHLEADPVLRVEWERGFKLQSDPRVIPGVGAFLRRWSLDELPQLWSVLRGDMSLVGPRPFPDYHLERFSPGPRALRHLVRPGITGLWQVTLRGDSDVRGQEASDHYYIRNWSVWLDLYILVKTFSAVISGRGAY